MSDRDLTTRLGSMAHLAAERRARLAAAGKCINGDAHDPPLPGRIKCAWCVLVHKVGVARAAGLAADHPDNPQPPKGWAPRQHRFKDPTKY